MGSMLLIRILRIKEGKDTELGTIRSSHKVVTMDGETTEEAEYVGGSKEMQRHMPALCLLGQAVFLPVPGGRKL